MSENSTAYNQQIQAALAHVERTEAQPLAETNRITLSSGVILQFRDKFPLMRINAIIERFPYPPVPELYDDDKGRVERNPFSKVYLEMRQQVDQDRANAVIDAVIATGTSLVYCPPDITPPDSDEWIEELEVTGITVHKSSKWARYLAWVKYVAIVQATDLALISNKFGITLGVSESQIAAAIEDTFPNP